MTLFDKTLRHQPAADPSTADTGADVAVVDAPADAPGNAAMMTGMIAHAAHNDPAPPEEAARPAAEPIAEVAPAISVAPAVDAVPAAPVTDPAPIAAADADASATHDIALVSPAELVPHEEHGLRTAGDAPGLTVFSRVVPSDPTLLVPRETQRLVNTIDESDPVLDQLRSLAATLHQARTGRELKVIAITSSVSGEGKTLLAANLALTLSRSYMRQVLLIDADLRRPNLHRLFGIPSQEGIRTALDAVREGTPVSVQEVAPRLALLPAGKPVRDPISVLASDAMQRLMTAATSTFDWVIVDTPPVGMLPDMSLLSTLSDAVLLVVEAGRVRYDLVQRTVESIGADRIFGVVLNKIPERDIVAAYGMHYYAPYR
jgi:capsular exopolysaccharide synthesis family protein